MSLDYQHNLDYNCVGQLKTLKGKVVHTYRANCYASCLPLPEQHQKNPDVKFYDFYWADNLSAHYGNTEVSDKAIALLKKSGVMRNTKVRRSRLAGIKIPKAYKLPNCEYYLRIRFDIDKCKGEELFLIGVIFRTFTTYPKILDNFVKLYREFGSKIDQSLLLISAHNLSWDANLTITGNSGHMICPPGFKKLSGTTFKDFLDIVDSKKLKVLRWSEGYDKVRLDDTFISRSKLKDKYGYPVSNFTRSLTPFSKEAVQSFLTPEEIA